MELIQLSCKTYLPKPVNYEPFHGLASASYALWQKPSSL